MVTSQSHARLRIPVEANGEPRDSVYPTLIKLPAENKCSFAKFLHLVILIHTLYLHDRFNVSIVKRRVFIYRKKRSFFSRYTSIKHRN